MTQTTLSLPDGSYYLSLEPGWQYWHFVQPCRNDCPGLGLPGALPAECLPWMSSGWKQEDFAAPGFPIGFLVSELPVLDVFSPAYLATYYIAAFSPSLLPISYVLNTPDAWSRASLIPAASKTRL